MRALGHVPEDRQRHGLVLSMSIAGQFGARPTEQSEVQVVLGRKLKAIEENGARRIAEYDIRAQSEAEPLSSLSGGNQQKVVMARELSRELKVLICAQPTRGARRSVPLSSCTARLLQYGTRASLCDCLE